MAAIRYNRVLIGALIIWVLVQIVKIPIEYFRTGKLNWAILYRAGGMPSSHSALIAAATHGVGKMLGYDSPVTAFAIAMAMIVIYDATGIRRQAGMHAEVINTIIQDLLEGHFPKTEKLAEVLGHSPLEAFVGLVLGVLFMELWLTV
ncbi:MAG: divergent PAP2 family protein [Anaerolineales bacterium]|nr:divergent PAP2 family protein [Anaerolineales bacterium]